jgi:hypothetical protein
MKRIQRMVGVITFILLAFVRRSLFAPRNRMPPVSPNGS